MQANGFLLSSTSLSFKDFIFRDKRNRLAIFFALGLIVIQFIILKYFYPYPSFIYDDSFVYLNTAHRNLGINSHMIGYPMFLRLFSVFTKSSIALVVFQYLFVQGSALFFLYTLFYFYQPGRWVKTILLCFVVLNPLMLLMANMVSSDCFFLSLSFIWFALLLWVINKPSAMIIVWHTVVLFISFTVRYNALLYPVIAVLAFGMSGLTWRKKIIGISAGFLLCGLFIVYTGSKYKELTGMWQYSPFSGWQLANNAMYAYRYVDSADRKPMPERLKALDNSIRVYFDSSRNVFEHPVELMQASTYYMWDRKLPLFTYMERQFGKDSADGEFKNWATIAPLYADYGTHIIKQYPWKYVQYFLWPNANKYYAPPIEFLEMYNSGKDSLRAVATEWFGYKSSIIKPRNNQFKINILNFYPVFSGTMNMIFLCCLLGFIFLRGLRSNSIFRKAVLLTSATWLLNAAFSICATAGALRFLAFSILLMSIIAVLIIDWIWKTALDTAADTKQTEPGTGMPEVHAETAL